MSILTESLGAARVGLPDDKSVERWDYFCAHLALPRRSPWPSLLASLRLGHQGWELPI